MANFFVKNAKHGYDLVSISYNKESFLIRGFYLENGPVDGMNQIAADNLTQNMTTYGSNSYLAYQNNNYRLQSELKLDKAYGEIQVGGTYLVYATANGSGLYNIRLDTAKFPDLDIYDWRYFNKQGMRPILKFCIYGEDQAFTDISKVYYLNSDNKNSVVFITEDDLTNLAVVGDGQTRVLPEFTYSVNDGVITLSTDQSVNGKVHIVNESNASVGHEYVLANGTVQLSDMVKRNSTQTASFDVLYGFAKVLTVTL